MRRLHRSRKPAIIAVTDARPSLSADIRQRERRYAWAMGIRTVCFLGTVATHGILQWVLFAAALVLPYFAVVIANAVREPGHPGPAAVILPMRTQLPPVDREGPTGIPGVSLHK